MAASRKMKRRRPLAWDSKFGEDELPQGPLTVHQLSCWPRQLMEDLCSSAHRKEMLQQNLRHGLLLGSDYAGSRNADDAVARMMAHLKDPLGLPSGAELTTAYTCDNSEGPMKVCLDGARPALHHFTDLKDRLPQHHQLDVESLMGERGSSKKKDKVRDAEAMQNIGKYLLRSCQHMFPRGRMQCKCERHFGLTCSVSLKPEDYELHPGAISMNIAGVTCVGWSPLGGRARHSHASMKDLHMWASSVRGMQPDLIFVECSNLFDKSILVWWFEDLYALVFFDHPGPIIFGHPMCRPRMYCALCHREKLIMTGSSEEYVRIFARSLILTGDAYFCAPVHDVLAEAEHLASVRKVAPPTEAALKGFDWMMLLPVGQKERFKTYDEARFPNEESRRLSPAHLADLEQNGGYGPGAGPLLPTLVTHGSIYSWNCKRVLTPAEHIFAMGGQPWLHQPNEAHPLPSLLAGLIAQGALSRIELKRLAGNAMHQPTVASIVFYTLSAVRRRVSEDPRLGWPLRVEAERPWGCGDDDENTVPYDLPPRRMASLVDDGSQAELWEPL